jgi:arginase
VHTGCRDDDEYLEETRSTIRLVLPASELLADHETAVERVLAALTESTIDRYWLHIDLDVLDPQFFPAVDSPDPGGLSPAQLIRLLERLAPSAVGASVGIYDPDLDPEREFAAVAVKIITEGLARLAADAT